MAKLLLALLSSVLIASAHPQNEDQKFIDMLNNLPLSSPCHCVPQDQCIGGQVATAGQGKLHYRNGATCPEGQVCCQLPEAATGNPFAPPVPVTPITRPALAPTVGATPPLTPAPTPSVPTRSQMTNEGPETSSKKDDISCGRRQEGGFFFRSAKNGGPKRAGAEEFPWTVAVYNKIAKSYLGAGSLIHPRAVLSVAHHYNYRREAEDVFVRAGVWDQSQDGSFQSQDSDVDEIVNHEDFNEGLKAYDVALLFLTTAIAPGPNIGFACLPHTSLVPAPSTRCIVTGWGSTEEGGAMQKIQKMIELPIWDRDSCQGAILQIQYVNPQYRLPQSMMCAGGESGVDTCKGDGGAPLVCAYSAKSARYYQAGIASWGVGCGVAGRPGVYTSVAYVRGWIDQQMQAHRYSTETYTPPAGAL